jgi:hypothetical protein
MLEQETAGIPTKLGPWWKAAPNFIRWSRLDKWDHLLAMAQERDVHRGRKGSEVIGKTAHPL